MTLVDLGCGGGIDVFAAANKLAPRTGKIIGIDSTMKMIARARRTAAQNNYTNVEFRLGELENLPLESNSTDVVTSNCVINLVPANARVSRDFQDTKAGRDQLPFPTLFQRANCPKGSRNDPQKWSECVSGALPLEELETNLEEAGFVDFRLFDEAKWDKTEDRIRASFNYILCHET